jgi:hypothetical protein
MPRGRREPRATTRVRRLDCAVSARVLTTDAPCKDFHDGLSCPDDDGATPAAAAVAVVSTRPCLPRPLPFFNSLESRIAVPETAAPNPGRARIGDHRIPPRTAAGRIATLMLAIGTARAEPVAIALVEVTLRELDAFRLATRRTPEGSTACVGASQCARRTRATREIDRVRVIDRGLMTRHLEGLNPKSASTKITNRSCFNFKTATPSLPLRAV